MLLKAGVNLPGSEFLQKRDDIWNRLWALTNNVDLHVCHRIDATDEVYDTSAVCSCSNEHAVKGNVMKPLGCWLFEVDDIVCVRTGVQLNLDVENLLFVVCDGDSYFCTRRHWSCDPQYPCSTNAPRQNLGNKVSPLSSNPTMAESVTFRSPKGPTVHDMSVVDLKGWKGCGEKRGWERKEYV